MHLLRHSFLFFIFYCLLGQATRAQVRLPAIFGDHMVLQQKQTNPVWGWAAPGETITVAIYGQSHTAKAGPKGYWKIHLRPIPAGGPYQMQIEGENSKFFFDDVLVGEVWVCSGQSNMAWELRNTNSAELAPIIPRSASSLCPV
jgi:sialate O-acetylesterase